MNSDTFPYEIYVGIGYLVNPVISTKFSVDITLLSSYCVILDHPVTEFIIVTDFIFKFYLITSLIIMYIPIVYTQSLFHDIFSDPLASNLPYLILDILYVGKCHY